ncbi:MAG: hypothetical protein J6X58_08105 [Bacteroidales bacterium]|nr:hypothetical protein [Bacteroidales bacterium]
MKAHHIFQYIIIPLLAFLSVSCEADFDELQDTDQRYITFRFETTGLLDDVFTFNNGSGGYGASLPCNKRLRINTYCFDKNGKLKDRTTLFVNEGDSASTTLRHLIKDTPYRFLFLADVVDYQNDETFFERWFQMKTYDLSLMYLVSFDWDAEASCNYVWRNSMLCEVENQSVDIVFSPIMYNGFIVYRNIKNLSDLEVRVARFMKLSPEPLRGLSRGNKPFEFDTPLPDSVVIPVSMPIVDDTIRFKTTRWLTATQGSREHNILNYSHKPFIIHVDGVSMNVEQSKFF